MKTTEIFEMDDNALKSKVTDLERELGVTKAGLSAHGGKGQNYKKLGVLRRAIAQIKTVIRQRELGLSKFVKTKKVAKPAAKPAEKKTEAKKETKPAEKPAEKKAEAKPAEKKEVKTEKKEDKKN